MYVQAFYDCDSGTMYAGASQLDIMCFTTHLTSCQRCGFQGAEEPILMNTMLSYVKEIQAVLAVQNPMTKQKTAIMHYPNALPDITPTYGHHEHALGQHLTPPYQHT